MDVVWVGQEGERALIKDWTPLEVCIMSCLELRRAKALEAIGGVGTPVCKPFNGEGLGPQHLNLKMKR